MHKKPRPLPHGSLPSNGIAAPSALAPAPQHPGPVLQLTPQDLKDLFALLDEFPHKFANVIDTIKQNCIAKFQAQNPAASPVQPPHEGQE